MSTIMPVFDRYPKEANLIGRILAGYGELEFDLCLCVATPTGDSVAILGQLRKKCQDHLSTYDAVADPAPRRLTDSIYQPVPQLPWELGLIFNAL